MKVFTEIQDGTLNIKVSGMLDTFNSDKLTEALLQEEKKDFTDIIVCLKEVDYLSSAGLRTLLQIRKTAHAHGGRAILENAGGFVLDVLRTVKFETLFEIR